jgi:hypothetical protein
MADIKLILGAASVIAGIMQYTPYIYDVLKRKTRPHAFSRLVWGLSGGIIFAAQIIEGGAAGSWATAVTTLLSTTVFLLSLFYGEKNITKLDWVCLIFALFALALWILTKNPLGSVILITIGDLIGYGPTIRKSIQKPHEETMSAYLMGDVKWILSLTALGSYSLTTCLYPAAMILANGVLVTLLFVRRSALAMKTQ